MTALVLWGCSANAASVDLTHPETLSPQMARQLVDLSAIESATMTVWFDGPFAPFEILGDSSAEALREYVATKTPGARNDEMLAMTEASRLMASVRFDVQVLNDDRKGIVVSVPAVHWGELEAFGARPDDHAACANATIMLPVLDIWSNMHLVGARVVFSEPIRAVESPTGIAVSMKDDPSGNRVFEVDPETLLIMSIGRPDEALGLQYVKAGERYLLAHTDASIGDQLVGQLDITFAQVDGVPWPRDILRREGAFVLPMHFGDVVLKDDVAPFLPADRVFDPELFEVRAPPPTDPANRGGWQGTFLEAIGKQFYSLAPAEALHFTLAQTGGEETWLSQDFVEKFNQKNRRSMTPPQRDAEIARLSQQVTYDVDVVLSPFSLRVSVVHLGELDGEISAEEVEALRQRAQTEIHSNVFGAPNHMMLQPGGFFPSTEVVSKAEHGPGGTTVTTTTAQGSHKVLAEDAAGLSLRIWSPDGARTDYTFGPSPTGTMLLRTVTSFTPSWQRVETITYTYGDVGGVTVPTWVRTIQSSFTLTNWRVVDATAPFLAKRTAPRSTP